MTASLDSFRKLAEPNLARHCDALLSTFVFRQDYIGGSPERVSLSTRIVLIPPGVTISGPIGERIFHSGLFRAARGIVPSGRVSALLSGFERGRLLPDGLPEQWTEPIALAVGAQLEHRSLDEPRFFDSSFPLPNFPWSVSGYEVSDHVHVTGTADSAFWSAFDRMQRELTAWDPPYLGMAGLAPVVALEDDDAIGVPLRLGMGVERAIRPSGGIRHHAAHSTFVVRQRRCLEVLFVGHNSSSAHGLGSVRPVIAQLTNDVLQMRAAYAHIRQPFPCTLHDRCNVGKQVIPT